MIAAQTRGSHGFALFEAVSALFVAAVGLMGSLQMLQYCVDEVRTINEFSIATRIIRNEVATLRAQPFESIRPGAESPFVSQSPEMSLLPLARAFAEISPDSAMPTQLKKVTVVVRWRTEYGRRAERSLSFLVSRGNE